MAYRPTTKTLARKAELRIRLFDAAFALVNRGGFGALTMAALAQQAGMATGALYRHCPSKAELCAEVFRIATEREVAVVQAAALQGDRPVAQRLALAVRAFAERALQNPRLAYALIAEPVDALVDAQRLHYRQAYADVFVTLITQGLERGELVDQNPQVSAAALVGVIAESLVGPLSPQRAADSRVDTDSLVAHISALCLRAVGARVASTALPTRTIGFV